MGEYIHVWATRKFLAELTRTLQRRPILARPVRRPTERPLTEGTLPPLPRHPFPFSLRVSNRYVPFPHLDRFLILRCRTDSCAPSTATTGSSTAPPLLPPPLPTPLRPPPNPSRAIATLSTTTRSRTTRTGTPSSASTSAPPSTPLLLSSSACPSGGNSRRRPGEERRRGVRRARGSRRSSELHHGTILGVFWAGAVAKEGRQ